MGTRYRDWVAKFTRGIGILRGALGSGFVGVLHGLMADTIADGASLAVTSPWMTLSSQPDDALALIATERQLPRYPSETIAQHRARNLGAWDAYEFGGDESSILGQLALAGHPGVRIYDPGNASFSPAPYWSHFIVYFPYGTHTVTAAGPAWGAFTWGSGTAFGPVGLTASDAATIRAIIAKWKPAEWICRQIVFELGGFIYGAGHTWGEGGLVWGGSTVTIGP